jgi:dipeptidyl-peptidase 4
VTQSLPRQIARTQRFTLGVPDNFTVAKDGGRVLFLRSRAGDDPVSCLWMLDTGSGAERLLADPAELLGGAEEDLPEAERSRRERERTSGTGIVGYAADDAARLVAFALSGELWTVDVTGGQVRRLPAAAGVVDPRPDPTGQRIAYVADGALRVIGADGSGDRALAEPDGPAVTFGLPEHVAAESMGRTRGYWWAPAGRRLLVARVDSAAVGLWYIGHPADPGKPSQAVRYPTAGTTNAEVTLWITRLDGTRTRVRWDRDAFEYVPAAGWDARGPYATVQTRDQRTVRWLGIDPDYGATWMLDEKHDRCWVELVPGLPARLRDGALVSHADRLGTRHLTVNRVLVTPPGLQLREVLGVDGHRVLFTASPAADPAQIQLWTYRVKEGMRPLSTEPGVHTGVRRGGTLVHVARGPDRPGSQVTVRREAEPAVTIASLAEPPVLDLSATPLTLGPRELRSLLFLPSWHTAGDGKLPVLLDPYAGPAMQKVTAAQRPELFVSRWFAEQGFAVLVTDGSGTPGRGPLWEREVYGDIFGPVLDDQVAAVQAAAREYPDLDLDRVGIRGWSFSGALAAVAVLRRPDVFRAAVAGAAVTDQRLYDTHWRERFLGHPGRYPERYDACSLLLDAPKLTRPLLLIHGLADDNVFPANTLRLSSALLEAGRPHEVLLLPGAAHDVRDEPAAENLYWHQARFLQRHLAAEPPATG